MNQNKNSIKVVNRSSSLELPKYQTPGSDGLDVMACFDCKSIDDPSKIQPIIIYSPKLVSATDILAEVASLHHRSPLYVDKEGVISILKSSIDPTSDDQEEKQVIEVTPESEITLYPGDRALIPTGLSTQLESIKRIHVSPRSGLALKSGITVLNSPGKIDSDYTGIIGVILINHGNTAFRIKHGDRIAQIALEDSNHLDWILVDSLDESERGSGGFGSTGTGKMQNVVDPSEVDPIPLFEVGEIVTEGQIIDLKFCKLQNQFLYTIKKHGSEEIVELHESDIENSLI